MKRDMKKIVAEYKAKYQLRPTRGRCFYADDIRQLFALAGIEDPTDTEFHLAGYALEAGFIIGHRRGVKDARERDLQIRSRGIQDPDLTPAERSLIEMLRRSDPAYSAVIFDLMREPLGPADKPETISDRACI